MRLKNVPGSRETVASSAYAITEPEQYKGRWAKDVFGNNNPVYIEIGTGKGQFITALAKQNPDIDYIGIEKYSSVLIRALEKAEQNEPANLKFIRMDAEDIETVFAEGEVSRIYLNFSDPWPKDRHAKRRLTSGRFLSKYTKIISDGALVEFKTDNRDLFDYSVEEIKTAGWKLLDVTYDLHNDTKMNEGNIMTEYEEKFSSIGNPIFKYVITSGKGK